MNYLFYIAHPSHYYTFKKLMATIRGGGGKVFVIIKTKDILEEILKRDGVNYINVSPRRRRNNVLSIAFDVFKRICVVTVFIIVHHIDRVVSCGSDIGLSARITRKPHFLFNDDDYFIVTNSARFGWPFVKVIFAPRSCDMGRFGYKTEYYSGYQKLFYLQDTVFKPNPEIVRNLVGEGRYFLIRTVGLEAHHDKGVRGLDNQLVKKIIAYLKPWGKVYITSEKQIPQEFREYELKINPTDIHHYIYYSDLLIGDSQSMVHEAAILGTPSIRCNDFAGKIGVLEELEKTYKLTLGYTPDQQDQLLSAINELVETEGIKEIYRERSKKMISEMIDVNEFVYWYLCNYPESRAVSTGSWDQNNVRYLGS